MRGTQGRLLAPDRQRGQQHRRAAGENRGVTRPAAARQQGGRRGGKPREGRGEENRRRRGGEWSSSSGAAGALGKRRKRRREAGSPDDLAAGVVAVDRHNRWNLCACAFVLSSRLVSIINIDSRAGAPHRGPLQVAAARQRAAEEKRAARAEGEGAEQARALALPASPRGRPRPPARRPPPARVRAVVFERVAASCNPPTPRPAPPSPLRPSRAAEAVPVVLQMPHPAQGREKEVPAHHAEHGRGQRPLRGLRPRPTQAERGGENEVDSVADAVLI